MVRSRVVSKHPNRLRWMRNIIGLVLYLAGGWRSYRQIAEEFSFSIKTARRNVKALEQAGLPVEWTKDPDSRGGAAQRSRLPVDWVSHTTWLRRYIIRKQPVQVRKEFYT